MSAQECGVEWSAGRESVCVNRPVSVWRGSSSLKSPETLEKQRLGRGTRYTGAPEHLSMTSDQVSLGWSRCALPRVEGVTGRTLAMLSQGSAGQGRLWKPGSLVHKDL